jgi:ubiquinone/menaquinone biosynthesis C-methylase UbiE
MSIFQDQAYLVSDQYKDAGNLSARIQLHEQFSTNPYGWFRWAFDQIDLPPTAHILEVGCGSGKLWSENQYRLPHGWQVILSDFSQGMALECRTGLAKSFDRFTFEVSNAMAIPFPPVTFDAVLANHMLYHVPDLPHTLAEIARVLRGDGTLYAATNGEKHLLEVDQLIEDHLPSANRGFLHNKPSGCFTLENGLAQLSLWFSQVEVRQYNDSLVVTEAEPLLAYIHSMIPHWGIPESTAVEATLDETIRELIQRKGCIRIQKSSGVLVAKK